MNSITEPKNWKFDDSFLISANEFVCRNVPNSLDK